MLRQSGRQVTGSQVALWFRTSKGIEHKPDALLKCAGVFCPFWLGDLGPVASAERTVGRMGGGGSLGGWVLAPCSSRGDATSMWVQGRGVHQAGRRGKRRADQWWLPEDARHTAEKTRLPSGPFTESLPCASSVLGLGAHRWYERGTAPLGEPSAWGRSGCPGS